MLSRRLICVSTSRWTAASAVSNGCSTMTTSAMPMAASLMVTRGFGSSGAAAESSSGGSGGFNPRRRRRKVAFPDHPLASPANAEEAVNNILYNTPSTAAMPVTRHVLNCLVSNEPGVLSRVSGILAGRGFNIDSLVVAKTEVPDLSRMTVVLNGQHSVIEQARRQLEDLVPVWAVLDYTHARIIERELLLVKVSAVPHEHISTDDADEDIEVEGYEQERDANHPKGLSPLLTASAHRQAIAELARLFGANILDISFDNLVIQLCAKPDKIDALLKLLKPYGIVEATRSGMMAMPRSPVDGFESDGEQQDESEETGGSVDASQLPPG